MKVVVNEKALIEAMEDLAAGTEEVEQEEPDGGWGNRDGEPIEASPVMSTQLAVDRPPVGDPDFMPTSTQQLSRSASTISEEVPQDQIDFFYRKLHDILDQALDRHGSSEYEDSETTEEPTEEEEEQESLEAAQEDIPDEEDAILESVFKKAISMILEQEDQDDDVIFTQTDEDDDYDYDDEWTEDEIDDIESTVRSLMTHFEEQEVGYEEEERESQVVNPGMKWKDPMRPEKMKIDLARALVYDQRSKELLGGLTPEIKGEVIKRIHARYIAMWSDLFASPEFIEQLEFNKEVDMEARKMMKNQTNEEVLAYLLAKAESETDPRRKEAYKTIATLTKQGAVVDTPTWDREMQEIELTPEQQRLADLEKAEKDLKKLDALATVFGFSAASGFRQWRMKFPEPIFKAVLGSEGGISEYQGFSNEAYKSMVLAMRKISEMVGLLTEEVEDDLEENPEDKDLEKMVEVLQKIDIELLEIRETATEDGDFDSNMVNSTMGGKILKQIFSSYFYKPPFTEYARTIKKYITNFLTGQGIDQKTAATFAKMFNGEVDLLPYNSSKLQMKKVRLGGVTPQLYRSTLTAAQKFNRAFFGKENREKMSANFEKTLRDPQKITRAIFDAIHDVLKWSSTESQNPQLQVTETRIRDIISGMI